jgi:hypothetical protein
MAWSTEIKTVHCDTPLEQVERVRQLRREAKAEYDRDFQELARYYQANPPSRRPFLVDDAFFQPVNTLANIRPEQRQLETKVAQSKARWTELRSEEATLEFAMELKR